MISGRFPGNEWATMDGYMLVPLEDRCNDKNVENQVLILKLNTKLNTLDFRTPLLKIVYSMSVTSPA